PRGAPARAGVRGRASATFLAHGGALAGTFTRATPNGGAPWPSDPPRRAGAACGTAEPFPSRWSPPSSRPPVIRRERPVSTEAHDPRPPRFGGWREYRSSRKARPRPRDAPRFPSPWAWEA